MQSNRTSIASQFFAQAHHAQATLQFCSNPKLPTLDKSPIVMSKKSRNQFAQKMTMDEQPNSIVLKDYYAENNSVLVSQKV